MLPPSWLVQVGSIRYTVTFLGASGRVSPLYGNYLGCFGSGQSVMPPSSCVTQVGSNRYTAAFLNDSGRVPATMSGDSATCDLLVECA